MIRTEQLADKRVGVPSHSRERQGSRTAVLSRSEPRRSSAASDDEVGRLLARLREQLREGPGKKIGTQLLRFSAW